MVDFAVHSLLDFSVPFFFVLWHPEFTLWHPPHPPPPPPRFSLLPAHPFEPPPRRPRRGPPRHRGPPATKSGNRGVGRGPVCTAPRGGSVHRAAWRLGVEAQLSVHGPSPNPPIPALRRGPPAAKSGFVGTGAGLGEGPCTPGRAAAGRRRGGVRGPRQNPSPREDPNDPNVSIAISIAIITIARL